MHSFRFHQTHLRPLGHWLLRGARGLLRRPDVSQVTAHCTTPTGTHSASPTRSHSLIHVVFWRLRMASCRSNQRLPLFQVYVDQVSSCLCPKYSASGSGGKSKHTRGFEWRRVAESTKSKVVQHAINKGQGRSILDRTRAESGDKHIFKCQERFCSEDPRRHVRRH